MKLQLSNTLSGQSGCHRIPRYECVIPNPFMPVEAKTILVILVIVI